MKCYIMLYRREEEIGSNQLDLFLPLAFLAIINTRGLVSKKAV